MVEEAEALVREALEAAVAAVAPSPARAEPHDASSWLPLPIVDELAPVSELIETTPAAARTGRKRFTRLLPSRRALGIAILVTATVVARRMGRRQAAARRVVPRSRSWSTARAPTSAPT